MKRPSVTWFLIFICFVIHFYPTKMIAQKSMIGLEIGYGRSQMTSHGHSWVSPFDPHFYTRWNVGIQYSLAVSPWLSVSSGLELIRRTRRDGTALEVNDMFSNLAIPFRVDFTVGNSFQFVIGPGLDLTYLISYDLGYYNNHSGFEKSKNALQANWQLHTGLGFLIQPKTRIYFLYELGFDLTRIYAFDLPNSKYELSERWYDGFLTMGLMTSLRKNVK